MIISQETIDLVKRWEVFRAKPYRDLVGELTIGYGYTNRAGFGPGVREGDIWTKLEAEKWLREGLDKYADAIRPGFKRKASANQFGAFVSLAYNVGPDDVLKSTALRRFNAGDIEGAAEALQWFNKADGRRVQGLVNRRADEAAFMLRDTTIDTCPIVPDVPRDGAGQSTTVWGAMVAALGSGAGVISAIGDLHPIAQTAIVVIGAAGLLGAAWVMRERVRKMIDGTDT